MASSVRSAGCIPGGPCGQCTRAVAGGHADRPALHVHRLHVDYFVNLREMQLMQLNRPRSTHVGRGLALVHGPAGMTSIIMQTTFCMDPIGDCPHSAEPGPSFELARRMRRHSNVLKHQHWCCTITISKSHASIPLDPAATSLSV